MARSGFTFEKDTYQTRRYNRRRVYAYDYLGRACALCGSKKSLFFSSRNQDERCPIRWGVRDENFLRSLDTAVLLCGECYSKKISRARGGYRHGTYYSARKLKCQCEICEQKREAIRADARASHAANLRRRAPSGRVERAEVRGMQRSKKDL
jgi:hypothetical protein